MNRKIIMSGLSIVSALVLLGGTAYAAFTATATATGNTFSSATPSLLIDTGAGPATTTTGFTVGGLIPGGSTAPQLFTLTNDGSGADLPVTLKFNVLPANTLPGGDVTFDVVCTGYPVISHTYSEWITTGDEIGTVPDNSILNCSMTATLNAGVGNEDAGKAAVFDAVFTGTEGL